MTALYTSISGPFRHENLDIFLFRGPQFLPERRFLPLHEALQQQKVVVHETGSVGQLEVENHSDLDLFIQAGDVVKGGRQDRTLGVDLVVSAFGGRVPVPAFCVESRRWHKRRNESDAVFTKSDTVLSNCHRSLQSVPPAVESKCTTSGRGFLMLGRLLLARTSRVFFLWDAAAACSCCFP